MQSWEHEDFYVWNPLLERATPNIKCDVSLLLSIIINPIWFVCSNWHHWFWFWRSWSHDWQWSPSKKDIGLLALIRPQKGRKVFMSSQGVSSLVMQSWNVDRLVHSTTALCLSSTQNQELKQSAVVLWFGVRFVLLVTRVKDFSWHVLIQNCQLYLDFFNLSYNLPKKRLLLSLLFIGRR